MAALFEYELLGTVREGARVTVYDAARPGEPGTRYAVSEIALERDTQPFFRECLECFRTGRCREFAAVYARRGKFYLVFRVAAAPGLPAALGGAPGSVAISRRFALLRAAVLALYGARELPFPLVLGAAAPENIRVERDGTPRLCFALTDAALETPPEEAERALCRAVGELLRLLFPQELENRDNGGLRLLAGKCAAGLYPSLPALASELGRVEESCAPPDWDRWAARVWRSWAERLGRAKKLLIPAALLAAVCALALFLPRGEPPAAMGEAFVIGNTVYAADPLAPNEAALTPPAPAGEKETEAPPCAVTSDPERFSDHVVRSGETLLSVCESYYGGAGFAPAVAAYNGLDPAAPLGAGTILKLPEPAGGTGGTT